MRFFTQKLHANSAGFTLIETLLVSSLIIIVSGLSLPVARSLQTTNDVDVAVVALAQNVRQAQLLAQSGASDDNWGVRVVVGDITLYRGTSYAARISGFDQQSAIAANITPTGVSEINFARITGTPSVTGTITLTGLYGKNGVLTINSHGVVSY